MSGFGGMSRLIVLALSLAARDPERKSPPFLSATATTDPVEWITDVLGCPRSSDRDLAPLQRRALPRAVRGAGPARHSFLRRSAARNKFYSPPPCVSSFPPARPGRPP